ncbi:Uncharacterised protein [uncultured archaeon]|nr:Uncharacterised protein [uncultured archaeon]
MAPLLWALGGALVMHLVNRKSQVHPSTSSLLAKPPVPPQAAQITPARAAVHGELMSNCIDPQKLVRGAALFGHEGLEHHAQALLQKAQMIHDMMHGAQSIVERCRAGDQHAMALAKGIGEQARAGNKRAQVSSLFIEEYSKAHPAEPAKVAA